MKYKCFGIVTHDTKNIGNVAIQFDCWSWISSVLFSGFYWKPTYAMAVNFTLTCYGIFLEYVFIIRQHLMEQNWPLKLKSTGAPSQDGRFVER